MVVVKCGRLVVAVMVHEHLVVQRGRMRQVHAAARLLFRFHVLQNVGDGRRMLLLLLVMVVMVLHDSRRRIVSLLGLLPLLGATILEPDFNLALGQPQRLGQLRLAADRDVARRVVLLLQLQALVVGVNDAVLVLGSRFACRNGGRKEKGGV